MKLLSGIKEKFASQTKKKKIITLLVAAVAVVGVVSFVKGQFFKKEIPLTSGEIRTTTLEKGSLSKTISVSGTVKSTTVVNVTTALTAKVKEIMVKVGDTVKKGDIIAKLDSTDIFKEISDIKSKLTDTKKSAQEAYDSAKVNADRSYDAAVAMEKEMENAKKARDAAYAPYKKALDSIALYQTSFDKAFALQQEKGIALNNASADKILKDEAYAKADAAHQKAVAEGAEQSVIDKLLAEKTTAQTNKTNAENALNSAKTAYTEAETAATKAKAELDSAKATANFTGLEATYSAAVAAAEQKRTTLDGLEKAYEANRDALAAAKKTLDNANNPKELEELYKKLNECTIKADASGIITAINATVGSAINTGVLAVIQDTDSLVISTSFKEYDIPNVKIGQKVSIKSDATGEKVITGRISQVSPTASSAQSGDVSFLAEITVDTPDSGLLIGMNAKADVILEQVTNAYIVPFDAVGTDMSGKKVVYVQQGTSFAPMEVTTGLANDYYIEIKGAGLNDGMVIRSSASEAGANMMAGTGDMMSAAGGSTQMSSGAAMVG